MIQQVDLGNELHLVQDPSKLQAYITCERMYFFEYIMNLDIEGANHNLVFGKAFHKAKDVLLSKGYSPQSVASAYEAFLEEYRKTYSDDTDLDWKGKNPSNVELALNEYVVEYCEDKFDCLHTEIGITVPIGNSRTIYGNMDSILQDDRGIFSLETKTAGAVWSYLADQFMMKFQVDTYTHFLYSYFEPKDVYGVIMDVCVFKKENDHLRIPCIKSINRIECWLWEANTVFDRLEKDFEALSKQTTDQLFMTAFMRRVESCVQYNRICPYFELCHAWNNPLQHIGTIPAGFVLKEWDPRRTGNKVELKV